MGSLAQILYGFACGRGSKSIFASWSRRGASEDGGVRISRGGERGSVGMLSWDEERLPPSTVRGIVLRHPSHIKGVSMILFWRS